MDFIFKLFIKDYDNPSSPKVRESYGSFASITGVLINVLLATLKLVAGLFSGSIAIIADSLNNYSDAGSSIVSLVSFKIAAKPADRDHPFGHARIEYVCSLIVSFLILLVGFELISESVTGLFTGATDKNISILTYVILAISIVIKLLLALFNFCVAKKIDSSVIKASGMDSISDSIATFAVLVANIIVSLTDWWFIDSIMGIIVAIMIFIAGINILIETNNSILGEAPTDELVSSIKEIVSRYPEIIGIHDMLVHNYGPNHFFASFHAEVDGKGDIFILHDTIDNIERVISNELGVACSIHLDPIVTDDAEVSRLKDIAAGTVVELYSGASIHDFRTVIGTTHTNMIFDIALPFEIKDSDDKVIERVQAAISKIDPNYFIVVTIDRQ